jgi:hypothetical protein
VDESRTFWHNIGMLNSTHEFDVLRSLKSEVTTPLHFTVNHDI